MDVMQTVKRIKLEEQIENENPEIKELSEEIRFYDAQIDFEKDTLKHIEKSREFADKTFKLERSNHILRGTMLGSLSGAAVEALNAVAKNVFDVDGIPAFAGFVTLAAAGTFLGYLNYRQNHRKDMLNEKYGTLERLAKQEQTCREVMEHYRQLSEEKSDIKKDMIAKEMQKRDFKDEPFVRKIT